MVEVGGRADRRGDDGAVPTTLFGSVRLKQFRFGNHNVRRSQLEVGVANGPASAGSATGIVLIANIGSRSCELKG